MSADTEYRTLQPAPGLQVRRPDGAHLAPDGERVPMTMYWRRRLADGDVVAVAPAKQTRSADKRE